MSVNNFLAPN